MNRYNVLFGLVLTLILFFACKGYAQGGSFFTMGGNRISRLELRQDSPQPIVFKSAFGSARDSWTTPDKFGHLLGSAMLSGSGFLALKVTRNDESHAFVLSVGMVTCLGILKEVYDAGHPNEQSSWKDLAADIIGAGLGAVIARSL